MIYWLVVQLSHSSAVTFIYIVSKFEQYDDTIIRTNHDKIYENEKFKLQRNILHVRLPVGGPWKFDQNNSQNFFYLL